MPRGRTTPDATGLYSGNLTGQTLTPGLYKWSTGVLVNDPGLTLSGGGVYIFQIEGNLTLGSGAQITLADGASAGNIFWQVAGGVGVEIGTTAHIEGTILAAAAIHLRTGASLNGSALAQKAVTLDANEVTPGTGTLPPPSEISFDITEITSPISFGDNSDVTVTVMQDNAVKTDYVGTIVFSSTDEDATLPEMYTFLAGDQGEKTFPGGVTFMTVGTQTVTAIDVDNSLTRGVSENIIVEKRTLTVTGVTADNKMYDGNTNAWIDIGGSRLVGVIAGDDVSLNVTNAIGTFDTKDVGVNKSVSISGLTLSGADAGKYILIQPVVTADITQAPNVQYELDISSTSGGLVTAPGEGVHVRDVGTVVDLFALTGNGYLFVNWTGDTETIADVNSASTTIIMSDDYSITANFTLESTTPTTVPPTSTTPTTVPPTSTTQPTTTAPTTVPIVQYNTTISSTSGGSVTAPGEGVFTNNSGSVVSIAAVANSGYEFVNWTGDTGTIANVNSASTTITVNGTYSITANFRTVAATTSPTTTDEQDPTVTPAGYPWWFWLALAAGVLIAFFFIFFAGRRRKKDNQQSS